MTRRQTLTERLRGRARTCEAERPEVMGILAHGSAVEEANGTSDELKLLIVVEGESTAGSASVERYAGYFEGLETGEGGPAIEVVGMLDFQERDAAGDPELRAARDAGILLVGSLPVAEADPW